MAILHTALPEDIRGSVEGLVVIKHWLGKTVITSFPDMSRVVFTEKQKAKQKRFSDAVAYAKSIISDPHKITAYSLKLPAGKKVFNAAIAAFMKGEIDLEEKCSDSVHLQLSYAQKPLLLNQNQTRPELDLTLKNCTSSRPLFLLCTSPPGFFHH